MLFPMTLLALQQAVQAAPQLGPSALNPSAMSPGDVNNLATGFIGAAVPFVVQLIRNHVLPDLKGKGAFYLSVGMAAVATTVAYLRTDATPTWGEALGHAGAAFTLSQIVFAHLEANLKGTQGENDATADALEAARDDAEESGEIPAIARPEAGAEAGASELENAPRPADKS